MRLAFVGSWLILAVSVASCSSSSTPAETEETLFPDVVAAEVSLEDDGTYRVAATLSSPYDSADRYADAWRVTTPDGQILGVRELLHDHAGEQPFTRFLEGVVIPSEVAEVVVEGRDQVSGWGGGTATAAVPESSN